MAITWIPFIFPGVPGVRCAFQTRMGGASRGAYGGGNISFATQDDHDAVLHNRQSLCACLGIDGFAELLQVHGDALIFEPDSTPPEALPIHEADGQATSRAGLGLMIKTADCQPILLAHTTGKYIAALHVGWRGNRTDFPQTVVERLCTQYALDPQDIVAVRGPSLGPAMAEFINFAEEWGDAYTAWYDAAQRTMDLWSLTRYQLQQAGLVPARIFGLDMCTASMPSLFFSYRKEKLSGRQASVIWMEKKCDE